jgi:uncharacterized protein YqeY
MSLQTNIRESIKKAMVAKEETRLLVLRGLLSAFTNELVAKGKKPSEELLDEDALAVIRRQVKQRKDSIEQFTAGKRKDLADNEEAELKILEVYLPQMMNREDVKRVVDAKVIEMGPPDKSKMGMLMGSVMKELKGKADGTVVKEVVEELFK